ncbi:hypothetical protein ES332_D06G202900v1 [Gossypium tomentosum]|uniref:Uncharacterized protein n=1 Tax=Gossypium tomentosum TaxID=34277 RepID=A0A5D2KL89_GOSTO|nr:hypothetical protein ES332_D06G202900v1 [Gossypium tomentosum]
MGNNGKSRVWTGTGVELVGGTLHNYYNYYYLAAIVLIEQAPLLFCRPPHPLPSCLNACLPIAPSFHFFFKQYDFNLMNIKVKTEESMYYTGSCKIRQMVGSEENLSSKELLQRTTKT